MVVGKMCTSAMRDQVGVPFRLCSLAKIFEVGLKNFGDFEFCGTRSLYAGAEKKIWNFEFGNQTRPKFFGLL